MSEWLRAYSGREHSDDGDGREGMGREWMGREWMWRDGMESGCGGMGRS